jgi:hypothetical protein
LQLYRKKAYHLSTDHKLKQGEVNCWNFDYGKYLWTTSSFFESQDY